MAGIESGPPNLEGNENPPIYSSIQDKLCFIDYVTKCKHGNEHIQFYDYEEQCRNWIDEVINASTISGEEQYMKNAIALKGN